MTAEPMKVFGAGLGRTGTHSLKIALEHVGFGPCHHMNEVPQHPRQVGLWSRALDGEADWAAIYKGYASAVDWPTAAFVDALATRYPSAKFVLTLRSAASWAESFAATVSRFVYGSDQSPEAMRPLLRMAAGALDRTGFSASLTPEALCKSFDAHSAAVRAAVPGSRLLEFSVDKGWEPLCHFLDRPVPDGPFPHNNRRDDFWHDIALASRTMGAPSPKAG